MFLPLLPPPPPPFVGASNTGSIVIGFGVELVTLHSQPE